MLFNDKKLTMYTSSKKGLTSNSYHVYPCISFQLKIQGTYTENIILLEKKTYRISGNHAYVVSFHGPNCNMPQHCCMRGSSLSSMFEKPGLKFNLFIFMLWFKCSIGLKFFKKARFLLSFALDGFIN